MTAGLDRAVGAEHGGAGPAATGPAATGPAATGPAATGPAATGRLAVLVSLGVTVLLLAAGAAGLARAGGQAGTPYLSLALSGAQPLADGATRLTLDVANQQAGSVVGVLEVRQAGGSEPIWTGAVEVAAESAVHAIVTVTVGCGRQLDVRLVAGSIVRSIQVGTPCPVATP